MYLYFIFDEIWLITIVKNIKILYDTFAKVYLLFEYKFTVPLYTHFSKLCNCHLSTYSILYWDTVSYIFWIHVLSLWLISMTPNINITKQGGQRIYQNTLNCVVHFLHKDIYVDIYNLIYSYCFKIINNSRFRLMKFIVIIYFIMFNAINKNRWISQLYLSTFFRLVSEICDI